MLATGRPCIEAVATRYFRPRRGWVLHYGKKNFASDAERVAFLFEPYQKYTSLLPGDSKPRRARKTKRSA